MKPEDFIPGILAVVRAATVSRDTLVKNLQQLTDDIRDGKHIPDGALSRANEDQRILDNLFNR